MPAQLWQMRRGGTADLIYQSWLPGARAIENEGAAGMLYVADITGIVDAETLQSFGKAALAELAESANEGQYYITRMSD